MSLWMTFMKGEKMNREKLVEKIEQKYCWNCTRYKKPVGGKKSKKFEVVCEENQRLNAMKWHKTIQLNFIDRMKMTCSMFNRITKFGG